MIQRQIQLPWRKAAEIAYKSIRLRLGRSMLVMSGIALAIAFFVSIQTSDAIVGSLRAWIRTAPPGQAQEAQELQVRLELRGVPTNDAAIADARLRSRWITSLALLVAFVGILNAMLMSVTERFREIGTMKCLGALDGFIIKLFLLESLFQGAAGTIVGIVAGLILSIMAASWNYGYDVMPNLPVRALLLITLASLAIGLLLTVAGALYPAWQAARMQPVAAMRVEG